MSLRVGSGALKGRRISVPHGPQRFSSGRTKKAMFDFLAPYLEGAKVLDLFAGAGGLGIEALSRGASFCLCVEADGAAASVLNKNLAALFPEERYEIWRKDFRRALAKLSAAQEKFDLVFADPPYRQDFLLELSEALSGLDVLQPSGILALERFKKGSFPAPENLLFWQERKSGDTVVSYFRRKE